MKVTVAETERDSIQNGTCVGFRVVHEGRGYVPGDTLDVPEDVARRWAAKRWIDPLALPKAAEEPKGEAAKPKRRGAHLKKPHPVTFIETGDADEQ